MDVRSDDHSNGNAWGLTFEGYKPRASGDKTLTAFAQLATLRLDVRRAMVSLVDSTQRKSHFLSENAASQPHLAALA